MNDRIEHPQVRVPFLKCLGKLFESCRSPFSLRRLAAAVVLVADLEDDLMEKPLLLALFNVPIVVRDLISRLCFLCVILRKGFIEKLMVDLFQIFPAQRNVLAGSTFSVMNLRLLCPMLPVPIIPDILTAILAPPVPFIIP